LHCSPHGLTRAGVGCRWRKTHMRVQRTVAVRCMETYERRWCSATLSPQPWIASSRRDSGWEQSASCGGGVGRGGGEIVPARAVRTAVRCGAARARHQVLRNDHPGWEGKRAMVDGVACQAAAVLGAASRRWRSGQSEGKHACASTRKLRRKGVPLLSVFSLSVFSLSLSLWGRSGSVQCMEAAR
jgi:hypothetical protein